jgi:hypothetical protein
MPSGNEYYQNISEPIIDLYAEIETELLNNIARKIGTGSNLLVEIEVGGSTELILEWQTSRLAQLGGLTEENARIIARLTGDSEEEILSIFQQALSFQTAGSEAAFQNALAAGANLNEVLPLLESTVVQNILQTAVSGTNTTFAGVNQVLLDQAGVTYRTAVNRISAKVLAGTLSPSKAVSQAIKQMSDQGIAGFIRSDGGRISGEAYAALVMRANTKNTVTAVQQQRAIEYGNDYIEINAYSGARPLCADDQGKIYSISGNTDPIEDLDGNIVQVLDWGASSFGEPAGILGINCGHQRFDFIPDFSTQVKTDVSQKENSKEYIQKQTQRKLERDIRSAKREKSMLEAAKAPQEAIDQSQRRISQRQGNMRNFIDTTGRTRRPDREQIK